MGRQGKKTESPGWIPGQHWCECERCGFAYRAGDMRPEWDGSRVCVDCWEKRHPQDFVRGVPDNSQAQGIVRPESASTFLSVSFADNSAQDPGVPSGTNDNTP